MPIALFELVKDFGFISCAPFETKKPKPANNITIKKKTKTIKMKSATNNK